MPQPGSFHWEDGPHPIAQAQSSQARQVLLQHPWAMASPCAGQGGGAEGGWDTHSSGKNSRGRLPPEIWHRAWLRRWLKPAVVGDL